MPELLPKTHVWYPLTNGGQWCQRCGCLQLGAERYLTTRQTLLVNIVADTHTEPVCRPRETYEDVIRRLMIYATDSDEYAEAVAEARKLLVKS
jgi:hypothetical protein